VSLFIISAGYNRTESKESESSGNGFVSSASPLLSSNSNQQEEVFQFPENINRVVSKMLGNEDHVTKKKTVAKSSKKGEAKTKVILKGISLYFNPGQLVAIMGPSGMYTHTHTRTHARTHTHTYTYTCTHTYCLLYPQAIRTTAVIQY